MGASYEQQSLQMLGHGHTAFVKGMEELWVVLVVKNPPANAGDVRDVGLIPESGRSPGGHGNPL